MSLRKGESLKLSMVAELRLSFASVSFAALHASIRDGSTEDHDN